MTAGYKYRAIDQGGRRTSGFLEALTEEAVYAQLLHRGLTPLDISNRAAMPGRVQGLGRRTLSKQALIDLVHDLGAMTQAGVDVRHALVVLGAHSTQRSPAAEVARVLEAEISAGRGLEAAFSKALGKRADAIVGLIAAAEASGNLGQSLSQAAVNMTDEAEAAESIVAAISYPAFVFVLTVVSMLIILVAVVPTLAPLIEGSGQRPPAVMAFMIATSNFLVTNGPSLACSLAAVALLAGVGGRMGIFRRPAEIWWIDGPLSTLARGLSYGNVLAAFGSLLAARVPASDALRLAQRTSRMSIIRDRLTTTAGRIREGAAVSEALSTCRGVPPAVVRLAAIGEQVGLLGPMLERAGRLERTRALRRIRSLSGWLGPTLIILLGAVIGLILSSLLSSVAAIGDSAAMG